MFKVVDVEFRKLSVCLGIWKQLREPKAAQHSMLHVTRLGTLPVCFSFVSSDQGLSLTACI